MSHNIEFGDMLRALLKERSLSMRKLSSLTGIDTSTISRIINKKQRAKPKHIQAFAPYLTVSQEYLLEAAGLKVKKERHLDIHTSIHAIQNTLELSNTFDKKYTITQVKEELANYEQYALTQEGQRIIHEQFPSKIRQVDGSGPFIAHLKQMYTQFSKDELIEKEKAITGSALLYFILATDIIPDYVFPIGYLDDAIAVNLVLKRLAELNRTIEQNESNE